MDWVVAGSRVVGLIGCWRCSGVSPIGALVIYPYISRLLLISV
ncbi:hypothetical protein RSAG8_05954, partial [Rhizoctonia solani AG-8 WAC10335]